jgi:hypothetical protein
MAESLETREAEQGQRMIEIRVRFWTNDLAEGKGRIRPKHAWGSGVVRISSNRSHDIVPHKPVPFNSMADIAGKIEKVLIDHGITIHKSDRERRYMS